jgi:hypothetical protein
LNVAANIQQIEYLPQVTGEQILAMFTKGQMSQLRDYIDSKTELMSRIWTHIDTESLLAGIRMVFSIDPRNITHPDILRDRLRYIVQTESEKQKKLQFSYKDGVFTDVIVVNAAPIIVNLCNNTTFNNFLIHVPQAVKQYFVGKVVEYGLFGVTSQVYSDAVLEMYPDAIYATNTGVIVPRTSTRQALWSIQVMIKNGHSMVLRTISGDIRIGVGLFVHPPNLFLKKYIDLKMTLHATGKTTITGADWETLNLVYGDYLMTSTVRPSDFLDVSDPGVQTPESVRSSTVRDKVVAKLRASGYHAPKTPIQVEYVLTNDRYGLEVGSLISDVLPEVGSLYSDMLTSMMNEFPDTVNV